MSDAGKDTRVLPPPVMKRVEALEEAQKKVEEQYQAFSAERKALEAKYQAIYAGLYKERAKVINGEEDPAADASIKGIPGFWLQAFQNSMAVSEFIEEADEDALNYLRDVTVDYLEDFQGFRLSFHFGENPYFTDSVLSKEVHIPDMFGGAIGSEPGVEKLVGCDIHWKDGKNLTVKTVKKTVKRQGKRKTVTSEDPVPSFFRFFETPNMEDDEENEDMEEQMALMQQIQAEINFAFALKNKIIPNAVNWFTGEAEDSEEEYGDEDDYDEEDEDDEEEDEEEEEEEKPKKGKKGGKKPAKKEEDDEDDDEDDEEAAKLASAFKNSVGTGAAAGGEEKPAECKQQ